jgi:GNAT superfamily N-acetyltransferase
MDLVVSVDATPSPRDVAVLEAGLTAHALPITNRPGFRPLAVFARDAAGCVVGGARGTTNWNWLHIGLLWVSDAERGQGLGRRLMSAIEDAGRARGCTRVHLDTFSYQARPFYEKLGYEIFATLDDYPPGHQRFFMRKTL